MDWARVLAYVTGMVDQELLARNEYLAAENLILKAQLKGRLQLCDAERATLGEIRAKGLPQPEMKAHVEGPLVFNNIALRLNAALAGLGLAYLPEDAVKTQLAKRRLVRVLADWCPTFSGYHLYYPSRRQHTPAFACGRGASLSWLRETAELTLIILSGFDPVEFGKRSFKFVIE
jgi:DNA-binding transcriptional LysR family regulator